MVWQEQVVPFLIIELLSEGTAAEDLSQTVRDIKHSSTKWQIYEQILPVPYYLVFSRDPNQLRMFQWQSGRYQAVTLRDGSVWLPQLQLGIGRWCGNYQWFKHYESEVDHCITDKELSVANYV